MDRINIYGEQGPNGRRPLIGWFDREATKGAYDEDTRWDGSNHISLATGSQWDHEMLYRTPQDRWVLRSWSQRQGKEDRYVFVTPEQAREWLLANNHDEAVEQVFGEVEQERGPGRPTVGTPINIRLSDQALAQVDQYAADKEMSRAAAVRELLGSALEILAPAGHPELAAWINSAATATLTMPGRLVRSLLGVLVRDMDGELAAVTFTENEANTLAGVHSGTIPGLALGQLAYYEMSDAFQIAGPTPGVSSYGEHFGIDEKALLTKLHGLTPLGDLALRLAIARWWELPEENRDVDGYRRVGINIAADLASAAR
ncbi:MAG: hypothetical protein O3A42_15320 [Actinobacteria bacterium]|nr:hypothetical protein [Actinomycetota bacterium]